MVSEAWIQAPSLTISTSLQESRISGSYSVVFFKPEMYKFHIQMETLYNKKEKSHHNEQNSIFKVTLKTKPV